MIKNDTAQESAQKMAAMILEHPDTVSRLGETIQGILCYIVENQGLYPAAASLMEAVLQNLIEAVEPDQLVH
jgi:hypothetical protein